MKALIEIEITGDVGVNLSDDDIHEILDFVIEEGAESGHLTGRYVIKEIIER
ncbi:hypothetical protein [Niallia circulans]|uniref:hypothetical protein n=1 Tax=Niallia circulans TaxID=1397 RepID=UPI00156113E9|nr:hypothetical protein [Niallia circulans]NRG30725.1 hypothetical protein [Niallia circulans]